MKLKGRVTFYIPAMIIITAMFVILRILFPKNAAMMPAFLVVMLLDVYLWLSLDDFLNLRHRVFRFIATVAFWIPFLMLVIFSSILLFRPMISLGIDFRTYWLGIIIIFYSAKLIPIVFLLFADLFRGIIYIFKFLVLKRNTLVKRASYLISTGWILGGLFFITLFTGMFFWTYSFRIREEKIVLPELPEAFNGLKIVQISDVHLGSWILEKKFSKAIKLVNDLNPDYIFVTGDLANYATTDVLPFAKELSALKAKNEIFVIMGNHDYGDYVTWDSDADKMHDRENLYRLYDSLHWVKLLNENRIIRRGNDSIAIIGVHNWGKAARFQRLGDIDKAVKGVSTMAVQLLLSHDPTYWTTVISKTHPEIDVTFSGHTHAMQLGFYLFGKEYSPAAFIYDTWGGMYQTPGSGSHPQYLYVNRGLGTIGYPGRVGELPEITVFTLTNGL